jgi:DNA polymerase-3 subunit alpha
MMAIDQNTTIEDPELFYTKTNEQYLKTRAELWQKYSIDGYSKGFGRELFENSCNNTLEVADKCEPFKPDLGPKLPKSLGGKNDDVELARLAYKGLVGKGLDKDERKYQMDGKMVTPREQMLNELKLFKEKDFSSYFLITRNLVKASSIPYSSPGRGSSAGSLVCFLLGITMINPLLFGLSFSRFLSPSRGGNMLSIGFPK